MSPRLAAALQIIEEVILHAAWGIYYQTPPLLELAEEFGNPSLLSRKAQHFVGGFETELPQFSALRLEGFYKMFDNLPLNDSLLGFLNKGNGFSYGFGILLQRCGTSKLNGWVSYSYTIARRSEYYYNDTIPPEFDVPHRATVVSTYSFAPGWQVGIKWQFASGRPNTPIESAVLDTLSGYYIPVFGKPNSERLPAYHTLDVRLLKGWQFHNWSLVLFIEALNAYNRKNIAEYKWNADYTERKDMMFYPIIPSIGLIIKF